MTVAVGIAIIKYAKLAYLIKLDLISCFSNHQIICMDFCFIESVDFS